MREWGGGSKSRTINISPRTIDRFVQHFAYAPYMTYMKMSHYVKLIVAQKRRGSKRGERGQEYDKVMWMATSAYFEFIFGRCPI